VEKPGPGRWNDRQGSEGRVRVKIGGTVRAFCPFSQMGIRRDENQAEYIGRSLSFNIAEYEEGGRNIVLSRKAILDREKQEKKQALKRNSQKGRRSEERLLRSRSSALLWISAAWKGSFRSRSSPGPGLTRSATSSRSARKSRSSSRSWTGRAIDTRSAERRAAGPVGPCCGLLSYRFVPYGDCLPSCSLLSVCYPE